MKEIVKEHPLRPIILRFDLTKEKPAFEVQGLEAYYAKHDSTWEMRVDLLRQRTLLIDLMDELTEIEIALLPVEQELEFIEAAAGLRSQDTLPEITGHFTIGLNDVATAINKHFGSMEAFYPKLKAAWDWFDNHAQFIYDHESWVSDDLNEPIHQLYARYEEVSVDIVSLDRDQQEFYAAYAKVSRLQDDYFACGDDLFTQYDKLVKRTDGLGHRFETSEARLNAQHGQMDD